MNKKRKISPNKEMSEGKAIALFVVLFAVGILILIYGLQFLINYLFPNF